MSHEGSRIKIGEYLQSTHNEDMILMSSIKGMVFGSETLNWAREMVQQIFALQA